MTPNTRSWLRLAAWGMLYGFAFGSAVGFGFGLATMDLA